MTSAAEVSIHAVSPLFAAGGAASCAQAGSARPSNKAALPMAIRVCGILPNFITRSLLFNELVSPARQPLRSAAGGKELQSRFAAFAGANADDLFNRQDEDFAVAELAGLRRLHDGVNRLVYHLQRQRHFDLHL